MLSTKKATPLLFKPVGLQRQTAVTLPFNRQPASVQSKGNPAPPVYRPAQLASVQRQVNMAPPVYRPAQSASVQRQLNTAPPVYRPAQVILRAPVPQPAAGVLQLRGNLNFNRGGGRPSNQNRGASDYRQMGRQADRNQRARSTWQDRQTRVANNRDPEERARRARERAAQQPAPRVWPIVRPAPDPAPDILPPFPLFEFALPVIPIPPVPTLLEESVTEIASSLAEWFEVVEVRTNARKMLSAYEKIQDQHNNRDLLSAQEKLEKVTTLNGPITQEQLTRALASVEEARAAKKAFDETGAGRITVKEEKWGKKTAAKPKISVGKLRKDYDGNDSDTWDMLPVRFVNVTRGVIESEPEGSGYIGHLGKGQLDGNGPAGRVRAAVGIRMHTHTSSGSHGISFIYVHINGRNVQPIVYDIAFGRKDNVYAWQNGAKSAASSSANYS